MAWAKLEGTFRNHWKPKRLAAELGVSRAEARGLVAALWAWAVEQAPDGDLSQLRVTEIEEAADWEGSPGEFVRAACLEHVQVLDKTKDGYVIHEFLERAESHKAATRKAKERDKKRRKNDQSRDSHATVTATSEMCPVGEERRGEEQRGENTDPPPAASVRVEVSGEPEGMREVRKSRGAFENMFEAEFIAAGARAGVKVAKFSPLERSQSSQVMRRCAEDGVGQGHLIAEWWHPSWRAVVGWQIAALEKHYASIVAAIADPKQRPKPKGAAVGATVSSVPTAEQAEEQRRRNGVDDGTPTDPEQAKAVIAQLKRDLSF